MRRKLVARPFLVFVVCAALALVGCSKKEAGGSAAGGGGSQTIKVAFVPKLQGVPYFEAMNTGGKQAAQDLGLEWIYNGPTTADPGAQTEIVKSLIQQQVDVLVVAPNDPDSMAPILADAKSKNIRVMTSDTDAPNSVRELFVNQATAEGIGQALTDALLEQAGADAEYAIVSCGQTAANLNSWIEVQKAYTAEKYPNAKIVDIVYAGEDEAKAVAMAKDLMNAHPNLKGLVGDLGAGYDLDEGGLARAVLPDQRVHLPGTDVEVDTAQRLDTAVALADARQAQQHLLFGHGFPALGVAAARGHRVALGGHGRGERPQ